LAPGWPGVFSRGGFQLGSQGIEPLSGYLLLRRYQRSLLQWTIPLRDEQDNANDLAQHGFRHPVAGSTNGHRVACRRTVSGLGTEAREAATERAALRMVALGVLAAQAARFRYADGWLRRLLSGFTELTRRRP
jgi:hypothetical protein